MSDEKIVITYETLFELLRLEKSREELQKLDDDFFKNVTSYLKEKVAISQKDDDNNIFASQEKDIARRQLENIRRILKDLYGKREKKILNMALNQSRLGSNIVDKTLMLKEEKALFDSIAKNLDLSRENVLMSILTGKDIVIGAGVQMNTADNVINQNKNEINQNNENNNQNIQNQQNNETNTQNNKIIIFKHAMPKFISDDLDTYGPFEAEDIACLSGNVADVLISRNRALELNLSP